VIEEMLYSCLHPDPQYRPSAVDLHKALTGEAVTFGTGSGRGSSGLSSLPSDRPAVSSDIRPIDEEEKTRRLDAEYIRMEIERLKEESSKKEEAERKRNAVPARLVLVSSDGIEQSIGARVVFGRVVLAKFGDDAKYANDQQFILERTGEEWFVEACAGTVNDTMVNGSLLPGGERIPLAIGDTIAIGKASRKKTVLELTIRKG
jgi:hypothetical protein